MRSNDREFIGLSRRLLGLQGFKPLELLGVGVEGAVWALEQKDWVAKVTTSKPELVVASIVMDMQFNGLEGGQGFVLVKSVSEDSQRGLGVIVAEKVHPLVAEGEWRGTDFQMNAAAAVNHAASELNNEAGARDVKSKTKLLPEERRAWFAVEEAETEFLATLERIESALPLVVAAAKGLWKHAGIAACDIAKSNLGRTIRSWGRGMRPKGSIVICDLGQHDWRANW